MILGICALTEVLGSSCDRSAGERNTPWKQLLFAVCYDGKVTRSPKNLAGFLTVLGLSAEKAEGPAESTSAEVRGERPRQSRVSEGLDAIFIPEGATYLGSTSSCWVFHLSFSK